GRVVGSLGVLEVPSARAGGLGGHVDGLAVADARSRLRVVWATLRNWCWRARQAGTRREGVLHSLAVRQADVPEVRQLNLRELEVGRLWDGWQWWQLCLSLRGGGQFPPGPSPAPAVR